MRKTLIITISAALLLCAVLCTAGCVEAPSDPIVGDWVAETDTSVSYAVFENDGAGYFAADADSVLTLDWKANGDKTYAFLFADGTTKTGTLDAERGILTVSDGYVLEKQVSALSGAAVGMTKEKMAGWMLMFAVKKTEKMKIEKEIGKLQEEKKQLEEKMKAFEMVKMPEEEKKKQLEERGMKLEGIEKQIEEKKKKLEETEKQIEETRMRLKQGKVQD